MNETAHDRTRGFAEPEPDDVALKRLRRLEQRVAQFEESSGVDISRHWTGGRVGGAVKFVLGGGVGRLRRELEELADRCDEVKAVIEAALAQGD